MCSVGICRFHTGPEVDRLACLILRWPYESIAATVLLGRCLYGVSSGFGGG